MRCSCGGRIQTYKTIQFDDIHVTLRYKKCLKCGLNYKTTESIERGEELEEIRPKQEAADPDQEE